MPNKLPITGLTELDSFPVLMRPAPVSLTHTCTETDRPFKHPVSPIHLPLAGPAFPHLLAVSVQTRSTFTPPSILAELAPILFLSGAKPHSSIPPSLGTNLHFPHWLNWAFFSSAKLDSLFSGWARLSASSWPGQARLFHPPLLHFPPPASPFPSSGKAEQASSEPAA